MTETTVDRKLLDIFEEAFNLYYSFETCNDPTNSPQFQANVRKCIQLFEDSTRLVSICGLFSTNESYLEIPTSDLKYLLLPFFLGTLTQKICGGTRIHTVEVAEAYFKDFLKRCSDYDLYKGNLKSTDNSSCMIGKSNETHNTLTLQRNRKLEKYRQKKALEDQIKLLKEAMKKEQDDDDTKRDFYVNLLKLSVIDAQEELASIDQEKQLLGFQRNGQQVQQEEPISSPRATTRSLKPIIITKDLAQKAVYGLGYPSLPTMTVAEFYDQRVRDGIFPDSSKVHANATSLQERYMQEQSNNFEPLDDIEREKKLEEDDDYELARLRAQDEYKDEHRRGEGNRYNRS